LFSRVQGNFAAAELARFLLKGEHQLSTHAPALKFRSHKEKFDIREGFCGK
jgi:hypothetical protein